MHELQWPAEFALEDEDKMDSDKKAPRKELSRIMRGRKLCNQRANSIADLAAVLKAVTTPVAEPKLALDKDGKPLVDEHGNPTGELEKPVGAESAASDAAPDADAGGKMVAEGEGASSATEQSTEQGTEQATEQVPEQAVEEEENVIGATVNWTDMFDAEYAESWPKRVVHAQLAPTLRRQKFGTYSFTKKKGKETL
jgi:hypothetical protein